MHSDFPVVIDACVLVNAPVCDLYLRLAETPRLYTPLWSSEILNEVHRTQTTALKRKYTTDQADHWRNEVTKSFPEACVDGWEALLPAMTNHDKDRHVLAAAVKAKATVIVTFNLKDFQPEALKPFGVEALHPQEYLLTLLSMNPQVVMGKLSAIANDFSAELQDTLICLGKCGVPKFSREILESLGTSDPTFSAGC